VLYENNLDFIVPAERRNAGMSFMKSGQKDRSISRMPPIKYDARCVAPGVVKVLRMFSPAW